MLWKFGFFAWKTRRKLDMLSKGKRMSATVSSDSFLHREPEHFISNENKCSFLTAFILALKFSLTSVKLHLSEIMEKSSNNYYHLTQ